MEKKTNKRHVKNEGGRKAVIMSFTASPDVRDQIRETASAANSSISRVVDGVIRDGFRSRLEQERENQISRRLESALSRLDGLTFANAKHQNVVSEMLLISAALSGSKTTKPNLIALAPEVFATPLHQVAWKAIGPNGQIEADQKAWRKLEVITADQGDSPVNVSPNDCYFRMLSEYSNLALSYADSAAHNVLASYLLRARCAESKPRNVLTKTQVNNEFERLAMLDAGVDPALYGERPARVHDALENEVHKLIQEHDEPSELLAIRRAEVYDQLIHRVAFRLGEDFFYVEAIAGSNKALHDHWDKALEE